MQALRLKRHLLLVLCWRPSTQPSPGAALPITLEIAILFRITIFFLTALWALLAHQPAHSAPRGGFKHVIIIFQENRTPDNLFGSNPTFEPGVDIASSGITSHGKTVALSPTPLAQCYDLGHNHLSFTNMFNYGADKVAATASTGCKIPLNPAYKYVDNRSATVQPYFDLASNFGFANRMFQTNQGPSFPAHQFIFGGTSAPSADSPLFAAENPHKNAALTTGVGCATTHTAAVAVINAQGSETANLPIHPCFIRPTLADTLDAAGLSWHYYAASPNSIWTAPNAIGAICQAKHVAGTLQCTGSSWVKNVAANNSNQILTDIANCQLPAVAWVTPSAANSDHPNTGATGTGPQWVASIVNAVGSQAACSHGESYWKDTAILITWDDWGGWFDHVKPPPAPVAPAWGAGYVYGFRVPLIVVSAYTPPHYVSNTVYDFGSLLYFTEQNFHLGFIGAGNSIYGNYADFAAAPRGRMAEFFSLITARPFTPIASLRTAQSFINEAPSSAPPDND